MVSTCWLHLACDHWEKHSTKNSWKETWIKHCFLRNVNKAFFPPSSNPIWRRDNLPCKQITSGRWQWCKCRNTKRIRSYFFLCFGDSEFAGNAQYFHLKNLVPNFCSKSSWISFCLMLHHWCPCCQLGWRIICIIHQKPGVDLTLKQFSKKETYWQPFSSLRFYQKGLEHWIGISFYCNFLKSLEEEYQTFDIWSLTK